MIINIDFRFDVYHKLDYIGYYDVFKSAKGWKWDQWIWPRDKVYNELTTIPTNFDASFSRIPDNFFQSGIGDKDECKFGSIVDVTTLHQIRSSDITILDCASLGTPILTKQWSPRVNRGAFYSQKDKNYLYSDNMVTLLGEGDTDENGFININLILAPEAGVPITIIQYGYTELSILPLKNFTQVSQFTGKVINGKRIDPSYDSSLVDPAFYEFKVSVNDDNSLINSKLTPSTSQPEYNFVLEHSPLNEYTVEFTREDIFRNELTEQEWQLRKSNKTTGFHPQLEDGDYYIGYQQGTGVRQVVELYYDDAPDEFGGISYTFDYPAKIQLNQNYGLDLIEKLGISNGQENQYFSTDYIPLFKDIVLTTTDGDGIITIWTRVTNLWETDITGEYIYEPSDYVYMVDEDYGEVYFGGGDGKPGAIPPVNHTIHLSYFTCPLISYDPEANENYFTEYRLNLNPINNIYNSGFLYISPDRVVPAYIEISTPIKQNSSTGLYGPVIIGSDEIFVEAKVLTRGGDPVPDAIVEFLADEDMGDFAQQYTITGSDGITNNTYQLSSSLKDFGYGTWWHLPILPVPSFELDDEFVPATAARYLDHRNPNIPTTALIPVEEDVEVANSLYVPSNIPIDESDLQDIITFVVYNDDPTNPYNPATRSGGRYNVLLDKDGKIAHPSSLEVGLNSTKLDFTNTTIPSVDTTPLSSALASVYIRAGSFGYDVCFAHSYDERYETATLNIEGPDGFRARGDYFVRQVNPDGMDGDEVITVAPGNGTIFRLDRGIPIDTDIITMSALPDPVGQAWPYMITAQLFKREYHIVGYVVMSKRTLGIKAQLACSRRPIESETLPFELILPEQYIGIFTLGINSVGSALGGANYFVPNPPYITKIHANISQNTEYPRIPDLSDFEIYGGNFPTQYIPSIWFTPVQQNVIGTDNNGDDIVKYKYLWDDSICVDQSKVIVERPTRIATTCPNLSNGIYRLGVGPLGADSETENKPYIDIQIVSEIN